MRRTWRMSGWMMAAALAAAMAGCAHQKETQPPAATFNGTLSEQVLPASILGPNWRMELGLMMDDLSQPTTVPAMRRVWAEKFIRQRAAAGARSYGEIFYFSPESPPVKVSTMILVYRDADKARAHWNDNYGPGMFARGFKRTNAYGDKSIESSKYDQIAVLAGNVILEAFQPLPGTANEMVIQAYVKQLGIDRPASP